MELPALLLIFFVSGMAGLLYQVVWVREFGLIFGNTLHSAALVSGVFMVGLGAGGLLAGFVADRAYRRDRLAPLRLYVLSEAWIGLLGASIAAVLPRLEALSAQFSSYVVGTHGWYHLSAGSYLFRYGIAILLVLPVTLLMGGTLTLLIRVVIRSDLSSAGWRAGLLYGLNTAGAATGCLLVDVLWIPRLGILSTELLAASPNIAAVAGGYVSRRCDRAASCWIGSQIAFALSALGALYFFDLETVQSEIHSLLTRSTAGLGLLEETAVHLGAIAQLVALPAFFMGFAFPLANAVVQRREESVGRRAGILYLFNCLGAVSGSTATAFILLPTLGMKGSVSVLIACAAGVTAPLALCRDRPARLPAGSRAPRRLLGAGLVATIVCLVAWSRVPDDYLIIRSFRAAGGKSLRGLLRKPYLLATSEGPLETILILEVPDRGRTLFTNGHRMSSTEIRAQRYMRAMSHLPLLHMDDPESVLVICFGVGNTAHAASLYASVNSIEIVDISEHVLEQAGFFSETNGRILEDPRVRVFVNDGRQHLRMRPAATYDLVTLEPPPINFTGVTALYSKEFYALVRDRLRAGGFVSQWLPIGQVPPATVRSMVRALVEVFPNAILVNGDSSDFILLGRKDRPITLDPVALARRLDANPPVRADLQRTEIGTDTEIFGMFAADAYRLKVGAGQSLPVTDDLPMLEYARIYRKRVDSPIDLLDVGRAPSWCPDCFQDGNALEPVGDLTTYLWIMNEIYVRAASESDATRAQGRLLPWDPPRDRGLVERTVRNSPYLHRILPGLRDNVEDTR